MTVKITQLIKRMKMEIWNRIIIFIFSLIFFVNSQPPRTCRKLTSCSCVDENNRIVNLTSLANKITPRFKDYHTVSSEKYKYSWNPCYNFEEGPENEGCINVGVCRISPEGGYTGIGQASTVRFSHDDNGNLSLVMTTSNGASNMETHVILYCDEKVDAHFRVIGEITPGVYWLQLWSKYNCPMAMEDVVNIEDPTMPPMPDSGHMTMPDSGIITSGPMPDPFTIPTPGVVTITAKPSPVIIGLAYIDILLFCILIMVTLILFVLLTRYALKLLSSNTRRPAYNLLPQYDVGEEEEIKWNFK